MAQKDDGVNENLMSLQLYKQLFSDLPLESMGEKRLHISESLAARVPSGKFMWSSAMGTRCSWTMSWCWMPTCLC
jgi:hypothetical protein